MEFDRLFLGSSEDKDLAPPRVRRGEVYLAIDSERAYQNEVISDDPAICGTIPKSVGDYLVLMQAYMTRAMETWVSTPGNQAALHMIRKVTAIGVKAMEQHGAPMREMAETPSYKQPTSTIPPGYVLSIPEVCQKCGGTKRDPNVDPVWVDVLKKPTLVHAVCLACYVAPTEEEKYGASSSSASFYRGDHTLNVYMVEYERKRLEAGLSSLKPGHYAVMLNMLREYIETNVEQWGDEFWTETVPNDLIKIGDAVMNDKRFES